MNTLKQIFPWVLLVITLLFLYDGCKTRESNSDLHAATQDSLHVSYDLRGLQTAKIALMQTENKKDFLRLKTNDSTIQALQGVVSDYKGKLYSATVLANSTSETGTTVTISAGVDTVIKDSLVFVYPRYKSSWSEKWSKGIIIATKDSISRNISIHNEYEITQGRSRIGFLKGKETIVIIRNLNPNTVTDELRTIRITDGNKISFGPQAGFGIMIGPGGGVRAGVYLGFGGQYRL